MSIHYRHKHVTINAKPMGTISYQFLHRHKHVTINAKPMGTISYQFLHRHKHVTINAKPMGTISYQFLHRHKHVTINAKPTGTISYQSMSTQTQACNYQRQTKGHDLQLIPLEQGQDYSLAVIKGKSLYIN